MEISRDDRRLFGAAESTVASFFIFMLILVAPVFSSPQDAGGIYLRANQIGYLPGDNKIALAFSQKAVGTKQFEVIDAASNRRVWGPLTLGANTGKW